MEEIELVRVSQSGKDVTSSLIVAKVFERRHDNVLRDIRELNCSDEFRSLNFEECLITIPLQTGGESRQKYYEITKDGFSFLVMGYTGAKAGEFKERFIRAFNQREALLKNDDYIIQRAMMVLHERTKALEQTIIKKDELIMVQDKKIKQLAPKAEVFERAMKSDDLVDIGQVAKILKLGFGRNTLYRLLREKHIFFNSRNEPKQEYINLGYFVYIELPPIPMGEGNSPMIHLKPYVTQKGLLFISKMFPKKEPTLF